MSEAEQAGGHYLRLPRSVVAILDSKATSEGVTTERLMEWALERYAAEVESANQGDTGGVRGQRESVSTGFPKEEAFERAGRSAAGDRLHKLLTAVALGIQTSVGTQITIKQLFGRMYSIRAGKTFTWGRVKTHGKEPREGAHIEFVVAKSWADAAGVTPDENHVKSVYGHPGSHWFLAEDEHSEQFERIVDALSKVCIARQQLGR